MEKRNETSEERNGVFDVVFIGTGPCSSLLLYYLIKILDKINPPLRIGAISTQKPGKWVGTYSSYLDEITDTWLYKEFKDKIIKHKWNNIELKNHKGDLLSVNRGYFMFDKEFLSSKCSALLNKNENIVFHQAKVYNVLERNEEVYLSCKNLESDEVFTIKSRYLVNGSGHFCQNIFLHARNLSKPRSEYYLTRKYQSFVGEELFIPDHKLDQNKCLLMDFTDLSTTQSYEKTENESKVKTKVDEDLMKPTFCYVLPLDKDTLFLEETVLLSRNKTNLKVIDQKLQQRKTNLLKQINKSDEEVKVNFKEKYHLPLGGPYPLKSKHCRILHIGGAGNFGHGATGYLLSFFIRKVPVLAENIKNCLIKETESLKINSNESVNILVQTQLNDMGSYLILFVESLRFVSGIMFCMFKSPYYFEFLTRSENFNFAHFLINKLVFTFHLSKLGFDLVLCLFKAIISYLCLRIFNF